MATHLGYLLDHFSALEKLHQNILQDFHKACVEPATVLKAEARQQENQNEQELPFMEVPAVTGTSAQEVQCEKERRVRFQEPPRKELEPRVEPNFRRQAPVEGRTSVNKVAENVLKQPVLISLEELAGTSPAL